MAVEKRALSPGPEPAVRDHYYLKVVFHGGAMAILRPASALVLVPVWWGGGAAVSLGADWGLVGGSSGSMLFHNLLFFAFT